MKSKILETIKPVIRMSKFVKIKKDALEKFCNNFKPQDLQFWMEASPFDLSDLEDKEKLNFIFVLDSLNFCYWGEPKWKIEYNGKQYDGTWAVIGCLRRARDNKIPILKAKFLARINEEELKEILKGNVLIPLFEERLKILRENGKILEQKYKEEFTNVLKKAQKDALKLLQVLVSDFPSFNDFAVYKGNKIFFHKRAQLLISDIYRVFRGENYGDLNNIDQLTAFADYKIPQILRKLGILEYTSELSFKVDNKILIPAGSQEEIEIRANTIWAIEIIKEKLKTKIPNIKSFDIDSYLWLLGQQKSPDDKPYHLTETIFY